MAVEEVSGRLPQHPADQLDALFGCLSRAMPTLPGRPNFMQEMLGLEVTEASLLRGLCCQMHQIRRHPLHAHLTFICCISLFQPYLTPHCGLCAFK